MLRVSTLPLVLAGIGGLAGLLSWTFEPLFLGAVFGYFLGKLVQSLVWTVSGPGTST